MIGSIMGQSLLGLRGVNEGSTAEDTDQGGEMVRGWNERRRGAVRLRRRAMRSIFPAPCSKMIGPLSLSAPSSSACFITAGLRMSHRFASGITEARSTTAPATTGEATEVPERLRQPPAAAGREETDWKQVLRKA